MHELKVVNYPNFLSNFLGLSGIIKATYLFAGLGLIFMSSKLNWLDYFAAIAGVS